MNLDPILTVPLPVQIHIAAALVALALGPVALYRSRRDRWHKRLGYVWVTAMGLTAATGFGIEAEILPVLGPFGPIHLFSIYALTSLVQSINAARRGDRVRHSAIMRALYWQALGIAGLLTLLPGRALNAVLFGQAPEAGVVVIIFGLVAIFTIPQWRIRHPSKPV